MLQKKSVREPLWDLLVELQSFEPFINYFLVGGTALSLQLGHRISDDIDLFTRDDINKEEILDCLDEHYKGNYQIASIQNRILQVTINEIKVDFVKYNYDLIEDIKIDSGIKFLGINDIAAMKLMAIANRGDQAKDFFDLYFLLNEMSLSQMLEHYKIKFKQSDITIIKRSLVYFDDITESNWKAVKLLSKNISANEVKQKLIDEVVKYSAGVIDGS